MKIQYRSFDNFVSYWVINEFDWIKLYKSLTDFFYPKNKFFDLQKKLHVLRFVRLDNQQPTTTETSTPLQKIYRGKFAAQTFLGKFEEIRAKYPSHPQNVPALTPTYPLLGFLTGQVLVCT